MAACISPRRRPAPRVAHVRHDAHRDPRRAQRDRPSLRAVRLRRACPRGASPDAAVAAAAHDVLVPVAGQQTTGAVPPACIDAGVASVEADYAAALAAIPDGPAKAARRRARPGGRRGRSSRCGPGDGAGHTARRRRLPAGHRSRASTASRPARRSRSRRAGARVDAVRAARRLTVPPGPAVCRDEPALRRRLQRGQGASAATASPRRARAPPSRPRSPVLGRELAAAVEPDRPHRRRDAAASTCGSRPACSGC